MTPRMLAAAVLVLAVALFGLGHCAGSLSAEGRAADALAAAETRALEASGALTAEVAKRKDIEAAAATLAGDLERARAAAPSARVVGVVRARTGGMVASGPAPAAPPADGGVASRAVGPQDAPPACLVPEGAVLDVRVTGARLRTEVGAEAVLGRAEVWRLAPAPEARIAEGPFDAKLSEWKRAEDAPRAVARPLPRWSLAADYGPGAVAAGLERRLVGGLWAGAVAGVVRGEAYIAGRVRLEWGK